MHEVAYAGEADSQAASGVEVGEVGGVESRGGGGAREPARLRGRA